MHRRCMQIALRLARRAGAAGEVPVGAVVTTTRASDGKVEIVARAENRRVRDCDPVGHAEIEALRKAGARLGNWYLFYPVLLQ